MSLFSPPAPGGRCSIARARGASLGALLVLWLALVVGLRGESRRMASAPAGVVEAGVPSFVVLEPAAIGLSSAPTDLQLLPDGRVLAVAQREIAFGDGVRWEVFRTHDTEEQSFNQVAVDATGQIYFGIEGGIARIELGADARWRAVKVAELPAGSGVETATLISVRTLDRGWYWFGGSGALVSWRPGETPQLAGRVSAVEQIFAVGDELYASEQASGGLFRLAAKTAAMERIGADTNLASETVTCTVPFAPGVVLAGTSATGLKLFDGTRFQPFGLGNLLNSGRRINDLCAVGDGLFAAAIDTTGLVFFDRHGVIVQVLERSLDHRLSRVQRLQYSRDGVLWALLGGSLARIEFPAQISHFEPLLASGLSYVRPIRHAGRLWLLAEGKSMRGVYTNTGRLERFEEDAPPGRYIFHLATVGDTLFATSDTGIFVRDGDRWTLAVGGIVNARIGLNEDSADRIVYVARNEIGVLRRTATGFAAERTFVPNLGDAYNSAAEASGRIWIELGNSRVARLDPRSTQPSIEFFDERDGLADGWVEIYVFEGVARFHLPNRLYRFDESTRRFVEDRALLDRHPALLTAHGRPTLGPDGKLWYTAHGRCYVLPMNERAGSATPQEVPVHFPPTEYTIEDNGVVWMYANRLLARFDPRVPVPPATPLRALVTGIQFTNTNQRMLAPGGTLPPIAAGDNSLIFHFAAPASPFAAALTFEVLLEGAGTQWVSTGNVGSAAFSRLKEGNYVFHVRPVVNDKPGAEARVAFTVRPPWYRSTLAWVLYFASAFTVFGFAAWLTTFLQRRENERLERLVAQRTEELKNSNQQLNLQIHATTEQSEALAASEERFRTLNAQLEHRVRDRTAELSLINEELLQRESLFRLIFEHAPVGISWKRKDLGDMYHFNSTFRRILRLPVNAPADEPSIRAMVHPEDASLLSRMRRLILTREADSFTIEQRFVLADGSLVWTALSVAVVRDREGQVLQDIGILEDITARKQAEQELAATYKSLMEASRMAGMAEVATGVLHNVGNVLNSLNVSANLLGDGVRLSKADSLARLAGLIHEHAADLGDFLTKDPKGRLVPEMLDKLAQHATAERNWLTQEISSMQNNIDHIKEIVAMQQNYATVVGVVETMDAAILFEDALRMNTAALMRHDITLVREFLPAPLVRVEKGKVLQILINLIRNAKYACDDAKPSEGAAKVVTVRVEAGPNGTTRLIVRDNGVGIAPENLTRIFAHGFTTRAYGHGFGLHSSALAAKDMRGSLIAQSDGLGLGATFVLELPGADAEDSPSPAPESISRAPWRSGPSATPPAAGTA